MIVDESDRRGDFILSGSQKLELMKASVNLSCRQGLPLETRRGYLSGKINGISSFNQHFYPSSQYLQERENEITPYKDIWETIHKVFLP